MKSAGAPSRRAAARRRLLYAVGFGFALSALAALLDADGTAADMGLFLNGVDGYGQFCATFGGGRLALAALALLAARRGEQPLLGDVTAMFLLAQPAGRLFAALTFGLPQGFSLILCGVQVAGGLLLLALRPAPLR